MTEKKERQENTIKDISDIIIDHPASYPERLIEIISHESYSPYRNIYQHLFRILNHIRASYSSEDIKKDVVLFSIWTKYADNISDSGNQIDKIIERLNSNITTFDEETTTDPGSYLTERVKEVLPPLEKKQIIDNLMKLYAMTKKEKTSKNISEYIENRIKEAELLADIYHDIIKDHIKTKSSEFRQIFRSIGRTGNILDDILDLKEDIKDKKYLFNITTYHKIKLVLALTKETAKTLFNHPILIKEIYPACKRFIGNRQYFSLITQNNQINQQFNNPTKISQSYP